MPEFPIYFSIEGQVDSVSISDSWEMKENNSLPITCSIPPEFDGPGSGYSPEGLFGISVVSWIMAMFKVLCEKNQLQFTSLKASAKLEMGYGCDTDRNLCIKEIDCQIEVKGSSDTEKAKKILNQAIQSCPVGNSILCGKTFNIDIS